MNRFFLLAAALLLFGAPFAQAQRVPATTTSDDARVHYVQGLDALANADFARARTHLDAALVADPAFAIAHMYRAVAGAEGREEHMRQATTHGARASEAERQMIESYAAHLDGDHEREIALVNTLAESYPADPYPPFQVGFELYGMERYDEAVAAFQRAIAADPNFGGAFNGLGYAAMEAGDDATAEQAFRDYVRVAPNEANPYDSYGEFLMNAGRLDEAEAQFEMALTKNPAFEVSRTNLMRTGIMRGNRAFEAAVARGDAKGVASLYTEGGIAYPPGAPPAQGREAIAELFAGYVANGVDGVTLETSEVRAMGDYAHEMGIGRISVGGEKGDPFNYSVLWMKDGDEWRLHRDIWN
ncbi:MAG: tetratricopeptide repeat protein [Rhodothermales bacterium]